MHSKNPKKFSVLKSTINIENLECFCMCVCVYVLLFFKFNRTIGMDEFRKLLPWEHTVVVHHEKKSDIPKVWQYMDIVCLKFF